MKHRFLLDENILHHGIKGVDRHDNPDFTAATVLRLIAVNCHTIVINRELLSRYWTHLQELFRERSPYFQPAFFVREFLQNSEKRSLEYDDPPELPSGVTIPSEDTHIVRAALVSRPFIVSADEGLREAINAQAVLGLKALSPNEAVELASEKCIPEREQEAGSPTPR